MKTLATQRTLKALRDYGWSACVVEKWITIPGIPGNGKRIDAFGFGDILACRPTLYEEKCHRCGILANHENMWNGREWRVRCKNCGVPTKIVRKKVIALVQCCPGASHAEHKAKILAIPEFEIWKQAGGIVMLVSWAKRGERGKKKQWTIREEQL